MIKGLLVEDYWLMLSEECSELAAAIAKLERRRIGRNFTPKTEEECFNAVIEELVDVRVAIDQTLDATGIDVFEYVIDEIHDDYDCRWMDVLQAASNLSAACNMYAFNKVGAKPTVSQLCFAIYVLSDTTDEMIRIEKISEAELRRRYREKLDRWKERQDNIQKFRGSTFEKEGDK